MYRYLVNKRISIISDGPFTLFAPTNEAFQKLDDRELSNLLEPSNQDELITTLQRHVIAEEPTLFKRGIKWSEHRTLSGEQIQTQVRSICISLNYLNIFRLSNIHFI